MRHGYRRRRRQARVLLSRVGGCCRWMGKSLIMAAEINGARYDRSVNIYGNTPVDDRFSRCWNRPHLITDLLGLEIPDSTDRGRMYALRRSGAGWKSTG